MLEDNYRLIQEIMNQAVSKRRVKSAVQIIAVTKSVSSATARLLPPIGVTHFAENRPEKLLQKQAELADLGSVTWHLVGTLQTRKIKDVINHIDYFHALDREKTAQEIQKRANQPIKCFIQVNVSREESKQGVYLDQVRKLIDTLKKYDKIVVVGLMTMAPFGETEEAIRASFNQLAVKQREIADLKLTHAPCTELSMGMSNDFKMAIEEGATFVRIGTKLFENNDGEGVQE